MSDVPDFLRVRGTDGEWYLSCEEVLAFLDDLVAGELAADRRAEFERHLVRCGSCAAYLETYRTTIALARGAHRELELAGAVPAELAAAILAARR